MYICIYIICMLFSINFIYGIYYIKCSSIDIFYTSICILLSISILLFISCVWVLVLMYVGTLCACPQRHKGHEVPWHWSYTQLWESNPVNEIFILASPNKRSILFTHCEPRLGRFYTVLTHIQIIAPCYLLCEPHLGCFCSISLSSGGISPGHELIIYPVSWQPPPPLSSFSPPQLLWSLSRPLTQVSGSASLSVLPNHRL